MIKKLPWPEIAVSVLAILIAAGIYIYAHRDVGRLEDAKQIGAGIVEALYRYRADNGAYPEQLERLVPGYIAEVQPPPWGLARWRYRRYTAAEVAPGAAAADSTEYFQLSVAENESGYPVLYYDLAARRWVLNN